MPRADLETINAAATVDAALPGTAPAEQGGTVDDVPRDQELAGLDALDLADDERASRARRLWSSLWPKLAGAAVGLFLWQCVVWSHWRPDYLLPGPVTVLQKLWHMTQDGDLGNAFGITLKRAGIGFAMALGVGVVIGALVSQVRFLRTAFGSLITGLQTMPSVAWFPLALLLFGLNESAITFVVVIGAAPSIANGLIGGTDHVPPTLIRAGRSMGAKRLQLYRHVILPAALPSFVSGLKQGWAFSWRSLMAGELLNVVQGKPSIGQLLDANRTASDSAGTMAVMILILVIGIVIDAAFFGGVDRFIRRRRGLATA